MDFRNNIPSFSTLRSNYFSRYICIDPYMMGKTRFSFCEGEKECVMKQANIAHTTTDMKIDDTEFYLDTKIKDCIVDSYLKVGNKFYLITDAEENYIVTEQIEESVNSGAMVELYSVPVYASRKERCCRILFGETFLKINDKSFTITSSTTIDDVISYYEKYTICHYIGTYMYFKGEGFSSETAFENFSEFPLESKMINITSSHKILKGDDVLFFNEDIRGNLTSEVLKASCSMTWSGYASTVILDKLDGDYTYSQLRAYPAYFSDKLPLYKSRPCIPDICFGATFGEEPDVIKGYTLYNEETKLNYYPKDMDHIANLVTTPSDLLLTKMIKGTLRLNAPNLIFTCDDDGIVQFLIESPLTEKFNFRFKSSSTLQVSFTDFEGNFIFIGDNSSIINASINNVIVTLQYNAKENIIFDLFSYNGTIANYISYEFVVREKNNSRCEVNCLHLNPLFKSYKELLATIGSSKTGEGRITL